MHRTRHACHLQACQLAWELARQVGEARKTLPQEMNLRFAGDLLALPDGLQGIRQEVRSEK